MNLADTEQKSASGAVVASTANTRLSGTRLIMARAVWLVLVVPSLGLYVISLPVYYQQLQTACFIGTACGKLFGALPAQGLQTLSTIGLSASGYAALFTIFSVIIAAIWCAVGFLIFWRRSDDWLALLAAFFLVMSTITPSSGNPTFMLALTYPVFALPFSLLGFLGQTSFSVFLLLFPNGRLVPRWMGLILLLVIINAFLNNFPSTTSTFETNWPGWLNLLVNLVIFGAIIYSQIYRYRRISTPVQRQQTKWIVLGVTAAIGFYIGLLVIDFLIPSLQNPNSLGEVIGSKISVILLPVAFFLIPLSIGFAILRFRLYEIDVLINRTLVYGTLTALLALLYFGLIFALQSLFQGIFHQNNAVAIVVSTLVIAALFQPLRRRIQTIIDRRFYRRKYDAAKIVEAFSATLRNEVDLDTLREQLIAVVQETMQPAHVSLWLRKPQQVEKHNPWVPNPPASE
jgi:hypothetical protein